MMEEQNVLEVKQSFNALLLVVFISTIGVALPYPVMAPLFLETYAIHIKQNLHIAPEILLGIAIGTYPLGQFIGSPILGLISDKKGRKKVLQISLWGTLIGYIISVFALYQLYLVGFILARLFTGFWEGNVPIARAAVADLSPTINKTKGFSYLNFVLNAGYVVGPLLGGLLSSKSILPLDTHLIPYLGAIVLTAFTLFYLNHSFVESIPRPIRTPKNHLLKFKINIRQYRDVIILITFSFLVTLSFDVFYQFFPVYLLKKWQFNSLEISLAIALLTVFMGLSNLFLVTWTDKKFSIENNIIATGLLYSLFIFLMVKPNNSLSILITFPVIGTIISVLGTHIPVLISNRANPEHQGTVMGFMMSLRFLGDGLIAIAGGILATFAYPLPLLFGSLIALVGTLCFAGYFLLGKKMGLYQNS